MTGVVALGLSSLPVLALGLQPAWTPRVGPASTAIVGGVLFGWLSDRLRRKKAVFLATRVASTESLSRLERATSSSLSELEADRPPPPPLV